MDSEYLATKLVENRLGLAGLDEPKVSSNSLAGLYVGV